MATPAPGFTVFHADFAALIFPGFEPPDITSVPALVHFSGLPVKRGTAMHACPIVAVEHSSPQRRSRASTRPYFHHVKGPSLVTSGLFPIAKNADGTESGVKLYVNEFFTVQNFHCWVRIRLLREFLKIHARRPAGILCVESSPGYLSCGQVRE